MAFAVEVRPSWPSTVTGHLSRSDAVALLCMSPEEAIARSVAVDQALTRSGTAGVRPVPPEEHVG